MLEYINDQFYQHCCVIVIDFVINEIKEGMLHKTMYHDNLVLIAETIAEL